MAKKKDVCKHRCSSNCEEGCNCKCGEYHINEEGNGKISITLAVQMAFDPLYEEIEEPIELSNII